MTIDSNSQRTLNKEDQAGIAIDANKLYQRQRCQRKLMHLEFNV